MFSPYYAARRRHGPADPAQHCAINVALYALGGTGRKRWAMTERGSGSLLRDANTLCIGPSALRWDGDDLVIDIDEITTPMPSRLRGRIRVQPAALFNHSIALDTAGKHRWGAIAPCARISVNFQQPGLRWSGSAYLDSNAGDAPLEQAFSQWNWSRMVTQSGTTVLYELQHRSMNTNTGMADEAFGFGLHFNLGGELQSFAPPPLTSLPPSRWGIPRTTRNDLGHIPGVIQTLEDTPFYTRSLVAGQMLGEPVMAIHESLSLNRFQSKWVQCLLPFRMPRRAG